MDKAYRFQLKATAIYERVSKLNPLYLGISYFNLATICHKMKNKMNDTEKYLQKGYDILKNCLPSKHPRLKKVLAFSKQLKIANKHLPLYILKELL
jgi:hypothetical protein